MDLRAVAVLLISFTAALSIAVRERARCNAIRTLLLFAEGVSEKARGRLTAFPLIVKELFDEGMSADFVKAFALSSGSAAPEAWKSAVRGTRLPLNVSEKNELAQFGLSIISCTRAQLDGVCDGYIASLEKKLESLAVISGGKTRAVCASIMCLGAMIAVMLA